MVQTPAMPEKQKPRQPAKPKQVISEPIPRLFNREVSWLEFDRRVLEEAMDENLPVLERLKFLSIFSSNLDEFFMIRVSGLKEQIEENVAELSLDGLSARQQVNEI